MNLKKWCLPLVIVCASAVAQARHITIQIKGMVCGFCAQGIEKKFKTLLEVERVQVSLESKKVDLDIKDGQDIADEQINKIVLDAGYEVLKIERVK